MFSTTRTARKLLSLALALCILLSLAACARDGGDGGAQQLSGTVYVPEYLELGTDLSYINGSCSDGKNVYIAGETTRRADTTDIDETYSLYTDEETGESYVMIEEYPILRVPLDGGEPQPLENYQPLPIPEGAQGNSYTQSICTGADGTLWVGEYMYYYTVDLPEDFDPETDDEWNYMSETVSQTCQRQIDSTGNELQRVDTTDLEERLAAAVGEETSDGDMMFTYTSDLFYDDQGNAYMIYGDKLCVMDTELNLLFTLDAEGSWNDPVRLGDGSTALLSSYSDVVTGDYGYQLRAVDMEKQDWGKTYLLPDGAYEAFPGGGDYLFYYQSGDVLYGCKAQEETEGESQISVTGEELLRWMDADINSSYIQFFEFLPDGRVLVMTEDYSRPSGQRFELAMLSAVDRSTLPEKVTLTYGAMYLNSSDRSRIINFNRSSDLYRIEVRDYSEYNTEDDPSGGLTRLNTEIVAGTIPDILAVNGMPVQQMAAKGLLEDLWPYIEKDGDLGREAVMEHVLDAASDEEGRLYQIFSNFSISTVAGAPSVVGDRMSWTAADLQEALAKMPEGCAIFGATDTASAVLNALLRQSLNNFVDWETGECSFESQAFQNLLTFCAQFQTEYNWENYDSTQDSEPDRLANGQQMLMEITLHDLQSMQMYEGMFGGAVSFVGYPAEDGSCGSCFSFSDGMVMSASCPDKEAAWSFMRDSLLPQEEDHYFGFPVSKADFEAMVEESMEAQYRTDENGDPVLDENGNPIEESHGSWGYDTFTVDVYATSQEEYDQFMALYNAIDRIDQDDQKISEIIADVTGGFFAGDTTLDNAVSQIQSRVKLYVNESR